MIQTRNTQLRMYEPSDLEAFTALLADVDVNALTGNGVYSQEQATVLFEKILALYATPSRPRHFDIWAVEQENQYIGHVELKETDVTSDRELEIVYMLVKEQWRKGFGLEIVTAVRDYARHIDRQIIATVNVNNTPSLRLLDKIGVASSSEIDHETVKIVLE